MPGKAAKVWITERQQPILIELRKSLTESRLGWSSNERRSYCGLSRVSSTNRSPWESAWGLGKSACGGDGGRRLGRS